MKNMGPNKGSSDDIINIRQKSHGAADRQKSHGTADRQGVTVQRVVHGANSAPVPERTTLQDVPTVGAHSAAVPERGTSQEEEDKLSDEDPGDDGNYSPSPKTDRRYNYSPPTVRVTQVPYEWNEPPFTLKRMTKVLSNARKFQPLADQAQGLATLDPVMKKAIEEGHEGDRE
jgi:hypothetical protein